MPIETEIKLKVEGHEPVREKLMATGAEHLSTMLERNRIFDRPDRSLFAAGSGLRVRGLLEADGTRARGATLTFKGPRRPGRIKSRTEIETEVRDAQAACAILEAIGFVKVLGFDKRRETWRLNDCRVELDELPHLGCFVEIEGPNEAAIHAVEQALLLDVGAAEERTYIALLVEHCEKTGQAREDIRFPPSTP